MAALEHTTPRAADYLERERQVIRIYERYAVEVVERFDLCPWAHRARLAGEVEPRVLFELGEAALGPALDAIGAVAHEQHVLVALLIFPRIGFGRLDFEHFVRRLRRADSERHEIGQTPFAMAAFHPDATCDASTPDRLVPFLRRSPDPTVQLVRQSVLDSMSPDAAGGTEYAEIWMVSAQGRKAARPPHVRERVALRNRETVTEQGPAALERVLSDIAEDRNRTYARLGLIPGSPA